MNTPRSVLIAVVLMFGPSVARSLAAELALGNPSKVQPELTPDKELLAKIEALPDNTWLKLPPAKIGGDRSWMTGWRSYFLLGPRIRSYCPRLAWAPERLRALYCGAGHNVHPWNDVWEYDLAANTWVCLYVPDPLERPPTSGNEKEILNWYRKNYVSRDGVLTTRRGAPVRPAHTWWGLCYDSDKRRMVFWDAHQGLLYPKQILDVDLLIKALGLQVKDRELRRPGGACVFTFSPEQAAWKEVFTGAPMAYEASNLEYLPDRKQFWLHSGSTYLCDPALSEWKPTVMAGPRPVNGGISAYDQDSGSIVDVRGSDAWIYSCVKNAWTKQGVLPDGDSAISPESVMFFDSTARRFVVITKVAVKDKDLPPVRVLLYDPKADRWSRPALQGDIPPKSAGAGYYDPARNVTIFCDGLSGVWVYRCQKAK